MRACKVCGKETRSTFCSSSCSAQAYETSVARREPPRLCAACKQPLKSRTSSHCDRCAAAIRVEAAKAAEIRTDRISQMPILDLGRDQWIEVPVPSDVDVEDENVFDVQQGFERRSFTRTTTIAELIRVLLAVVRKRPRYINASDAPRYATLLHAFGQHHVPQGWWHGCVGGRAETFRVTELGRVVDSWVRHTYQTKDRDPFLISIVIDAIQFIKAHCCGYSFHWERGQVRGRIEPLLNEQLVEEMRESFRFLSEPQFKKGVTEEIGGTTVRVRVPHDVRMRTSGILRGDIPGDTQFVFSVRRCHLSQFQGMIGTYPHMLPYAADGFDIAENFEFEGDVHFATVPRDGNPLPCFADDEHPSTYVLPAIVPFRWFQEMLRPHDYGRTFEWVRMRSFVAAVA